MDSNTTSGVPWCASAWRFAHDDVRGQSQAQIPRAFMASAEVKELNGAELRVWMILASYKDHRDGLAYPTITMLSTDSGLHYDTVKKAIRTLKRRLIEVADYTKDPTGKRQGYRLCVPLSLITTGAVVSTGT